MWDQQFKIGRGEDFWQHGTHVSKVSNSLSRVHSFVLNFYVQSFDRVDTGQFLICRNFLRFVNRSFGDFFTIIVVKLHIFFCQTHKLCWNLKIYNFGCRIFLCFKKLCWINLHIFLCRIFVFEFQSIVYHPCVDINYLFRGDRSDF